MEQDEKVALWNSIDGLYQALNYLLEIVEEETNFTTEEIRENAKFFMKNVEEDLEKFL